MATDEGTLSAERRRCGALTKSGAYCRAWALPDGRGFCFAHAPGSDQARVQGGHARSNVQRGVRRLPPDLRDVMGRVATAVEQVHEGALDPRRLSAMASGAQALIRLVEVALLSNEIEELQRQVAEIAAQRTIEAVRAPGAITGTGTGRGRIPR